MAARQHSPVTAYTMLAKAGLWAWVWSVRASVGDPGDGSFGWVAWTWGPQGEWVDVPMVNLGYLPWLFELRIRSRGVPFRDPDGREVHRAWIGPRSVRWVRMQPAEPLRPDEKVEVELCTTPALAWLRPVECHAFAVVSGIGGRGP